jgi:hypothetical protein
MNCRHVEYGVRLAAKMRAWLELAVAGIEKSDRVRPRRKFCRLIRAYPEVASCQGLTRKSL